MAGNVLHIQFCQLLKITTFLDVPNFSLGNDLTLVLAWGDARPLLKLFTEIRNTASAHHVGNFLDRVFRGA